MEKSWDDDPNDVWYAPHGEKNPEHRLVLAIIRQALIDLEKGTDEDAKSAFWWMYVMESDCVGSLAWCCDVLDLNKRVIRMQVNTYSPRLWQFACEYVLDHCPAKEVLECGVLCKTN